MGPVETALRADLAALGGPESAETGTAGGTLSAVALNLAQKLDGDAGLATAAVARQLQAVLAALGLAGRDDPGEDAAAALIARLSTPVLDPAAAGARDVRPARRGGGRAAGTAADAVGPPRRGRGTGG